MPPTTIGRYEVLQQLGKGGMATVYLARDPFFGRQVAIKVLSSLFSHDPQFQARFEREAKVIAALEHPYIVPVYDYGREGDQTFLVMRYMPGGNLGERRTTGQPISPAEIVTLFQRLGEALDEAHRQGIIHRDLKPANVMFDGRDHAYLSDFGIAKLMQSSSSFTGSAVLGTPAYMSPEQAMGSKGVDGRSDVYSLGVMLYEMLAGRRPFHATTPVQLMFKQITDPLPPLDTEALHLPVACNAVLAKALAKEPIQRYATPGEFAAAVAGLWGTTPVAVSSPPLAAPPPPTPSITTAPGASPRPVSALPTATAHPPRGLSQSRWWLASLLVPLIGVFACGALAGGLWLVNANRKPTPTRTTAPTLTLPAVLVATATATPVPPTLTLTAEATSTATLTFTETPTETATPTLTARPPTRRRWKRAV